MRRSTLLQSAYGRLGERYLERAVFIQQQSVYLLLVGSVAFLSLYVEMSLGEFFRLSLVGCALQFVYSLLTVRLTRRLARPVTDWLRGERSEEATIAAWRTAACLPWELLRRGLILLPLGPVLWSFFLLWCLYFAWELDLSVGSGLLVYAAVIVVVAYGAALRFFAAERIVRPVLEDIAPTLPRGAESGVHGLSLRGRLLAGLPAINVITAVVAYGLARGGDADLTDLALVVAIAAAVAASSSLVLTVLLADSITEPISELREAARRVGAGDFDVQVPRLTTDETGELAGAFNEMTLGLAERERLREAFGTFVDPDLTERVLREGTDLAGDRADVSVLFMDIRGFTSYAEQASPEDVVARLNDLYENVVPVILNHGGHANKFIGDGLLAVFGAPERHSDHADRAVAAALEIAELVRDRYRGELRVGVGINSGPVVAGTVGGGGRLDFTVIGDVVNTAARVEGATRETDDDVLITEATRRALSRDVGGFQERPPIPLKGKAEEVPLFAPIEWADAGKAPDTPDATEGVRAKVGDRKDVAK